MTVDEQRASEIMQRCIFEEIDEILEELQILMKRPEGMNAIRKMIMKKVEEFDFINNYNYAYLLQEMQNSDLSNFVVDRSIQMLYLYLLSSENQKTILWSKFIA